MKKKSGRMTIQYLRLANKSPLGKVDSMSKLITVFLVSIFAVMAANTWVLGLTVLFLSIMIIIFGKVPITTFLRGVRIFVLFGLGLFIFQLLFNHRGEQIVHFLFLNINQGGLEMGIQKLLTAITMGLATLGFIWTTNPREMIAGLVNVGIPYRFAWGLFLVLRYVPAFESELQVIKDAQKVRGIKQGGGIRGQVEMLKRYTTPLFISMATKARDIAVAMDCRAFSAFPQRVFRDKFQWSKSGIFMLVVIITLMIVCILIFGMAVRRTITF
jgi:energy-coupling factor transporter transmembrane protein EcfT